MRVGVECGQRWWHPRSWRRPRGATGPHLWRPLVLDGRRIGTAIGPVMFFRGGSLRFCWPVRRFGPRCSVAPPWRLADAEPCCIYRGHEQDHQRPSPDWHADGTGYAWNADRWRWNGPVIDLEDMYTSSEGFKAVFEEWPDA